MHAQHDRHRGWNPFWAALGAALLVLVPLVGGTVLLSRQQLSRQLRQAARSQQGVAVQLPRESDRLTVLVCTAGEQPGFVLAYLNASQNGVHLLAVPAGLQVTFADEDAALADCYAAAASRIASSIRIPLNVLIPCRMTVPFGKRSCPWAVVELTSANSSIAG